MLDTEMGGRGQPQVLAQVLRTKKKREEHVCTAPKSIDLSHQGAFRGQV